MKWDYGEPEDFVVSGSGLFIVCEGNFQYGNGSLSYYDPAERTVVNEAFFRANGYRLGDVAQSMTMANGLGWIVVNNSHVVFAIDPQTFREVGRITGFTSPRYIHFVSPTKAYVTQLWDNRIFIVDPVAYRITGHITVPGMAFDQGSTEEMVQIGDYVYCNCWSYQKKLSGSTPGQIVSTARLRSECSRHRLSAIVSDGCGHCRTVVLREILQAMNRLRSIASTPKILKSSVSFSSAALTIRRH